MKVREDVRRKSVQMVFVEREYERNEERGYDNGNKRERRILREERPVKMEE